MSIDLEQPANPENMVEKMGESDRRAKQGSERGEELVGLGWGRLGGNGSYQILNPFLAPLHRFTQTYIRSLHPQCRIFE